MDKICSRCTKLKPINEFAWKNKEKGWYHPYCRTCQAEYKQKHYQDNKEKYLQNSYNRRYLLRARVSDYKTQLGCSDCDIRDPRVLDFDHIEDNKEDNVSALVNKTVAWSSILAEMLKCEVVCSNCHRIRTWQRKRV